MITTKNNGWVHNGKRCCQFVLRLTAAVLFSACFSASVWAQSSAVIHGAVTDEQGAKVAGASVRLSSRTGIHLSKSSNDEGKFEFASLPPGEYFIEVSHAGFSDFTSDEITVARADETQVSVTLKVAGISESVVVTATGTAQRVDEVSKVISILDAAEIEQKHELLLPEALRGSPGVRVQQQGSPGALTTLRIRGQRAFDTAILLDGMRVRDAGDINGSAASLMTDLSPVAMDRVEVLRGAGSSIYGTSAVGGVVNMVTETPRDGTHFELGAEGGGLKAFRERFKLSSGWKRFGFNLGVNRLDVRRGIDDEDQYGNSAGSARVQFSITPTIVITGNLYGTISNARLNDSPLALPAAFTVTSGFAKAVPGVTFHPDLNNPDEGRRNRLLVGSLRLTAQPNENISYSVAYQRVASQRRNYNGPRIDPRLAAFYPFGDFEFFSLNRGTTDTFDGRVNVRLGQSNLVTGGFEFENESLFQQSIPSFSFFHNTTDRQRTFAVFGQDQVSLLDDRLQVSIAARGQFFRIRAADRPGFLNSINGERSLTGDASVAYFVRSTGTKLHGHVGNGFRAASLYERFGGGTFQGLGFVRFGDPTLRAEQSISVDAGIDQRFARDRVLASANYFYTRLQRAIALQSSFVVDPLGLGRFSGFVNQPGGLARGVETSLEASPARGTNLRLTYTYTNSDRSLVSRGLQPEYVIPKNVFGLMFNQRYRAFAFNFDVTRTGSYLAPVFENDFPFRSAELIFPGYTKADVFGSYEKRMADRTTIVIFGGADNVFNRRYYENGFLAPGIVGRAGVSLKF